jgi:hypothetical protein
MTRYLYGINSHYGLSELTIEKTKIIKETDKTFLVEHRISAYNSSTRILKDNPNIAFSEEEAVAVFIRDNQTEVYQLTERLMEKEEKILQAKRLLKKE